MAVFTKYADKNREIIKTPNYNPFHPNETIQEEWKQMKYYIMYMEQKVSYYSFFLVQIVFTV